MEVNLFMQNMNFFLIVFVFLVSWWIYSTLQMFFCAHVWHSVTHFTHHPLTCRSGVVPLRLLQTIVFVFYISCCSSLCQKTARWYLGNCRLWGRAPDSTRAPGVSKGKRRHDVSTRITSCLAPSKAKVSGQISLYNRQDEKQQPQSDVVCALGHNGVYIYARCFLVCLCEYALMYLRMH